MIKGRLCHTGQLVCTKRLILSAGHNIFLTNLALRAMSQAINIGDVHVIITLVSAKQVYNGNVKVFNEISILFVILFSVPSWLLVMSYFMCNISLYCLAW